MNAGFLFHPGHPIADIAPRDAHQMHRRLRHIIAIGRGDQPLDLAAAHAKDAFDVIDLSAWITTTVLCTRAR
jgi:hypothetical protein